MASPPSGQWQALREPGIGGRPSSLVVSPHDGDRVLIGGDILGVGLSLDGGQSWQPTFGFDSYEMGDFSWHPDDPDTVWVGSMSGPYVSRDGGRNWESRRNGMPDFTNFDYSVPIERILFDPNDADRLLAFGGSNQRYRVNQTGGRLGSVWESTNAGQSWSQITSLTPTGSATGIDSKSVNIVSVEFAANSSDRLIASVDDRGVYVSNNGGRNWTPSNTGLPHTHTEVVQAHPTDPDIAFISLTAFDNGSDIFPGGVFKTTNGGQSWASISGNLPQRSGSNLNLSSRYEGMALAPSEPDVIFAADDDFVSKGGYLTQNGGGSWSNVFNRNIADAPYPPIDQLEVVHFNPNNADHIYATGSLNGFFTKDRGQTWDNLGAEYLGQNELGKDTWVGRGYSGVVATNVIVNPWTPGHIIVQGWDATRLWQSKDDGQSWTVEATDNGVYGGGSEAVFANADVAYATLGINPGSFNGIARTIDGGDTWEVLETATGLPAIGSNARPYGIMTLGSDADRVWAAIDGTVYESTDGGDSWSADLTGAGARYFTANAERTSIYVSGTDDVYRSTNGGAWSNIGGPGLAGKMDVGTDGVLWVAAHRGGGNPGKGLWRYDEIDGWEVVLDPDLLTGELKRLSEYINDVAVDPFDPNRLAVITDDDPFRDVMRSSGVWLSEDGGLSWSAFNDNLRMTRGGTITFDPHTRDRLLIGTNGGGFFEVSIPEPTTSVVIGAAAGGAIACRGRRRTR
ncbi:MAG: hypothetical protein AAFY08_05960 [Planctomycetota bacterium]